MADSRIGAGDMQMNQKHLVVPENKKVERKREVGKKEGRRLWESWSKGR